MKTAFPYYPRIKPSGHWAAVLLVPAASDLAAELRVLEAVGRSASAAVVSSPIETVKRRSNDGGHAACLSGGGSVMLVWEMLVAMPLLRSV
jgi:hypothetical protein